MNASVFVFGTLKEGFPNFATNTGTRVPGSFRTRRRFPLFLVGDRCVPWLLATPDQGGQVLGQVFEVDAPTLEAMDRLEGVGEPDGYVRVELEVERTDQPGAPATTVFAYLKDPAQLTVAMPRIGPLLEYTLEHASLYRRRAAP